MYVDFFEVSIKIEMSWVGNVDRRGASLRSRGPRLSGRTATAVKTSEAILHGPSLGR
jgi:hypothetical protein